MNYSLMINPFVLEPSSDPDPNFGCILGGGATCYPPPPQLRGGYLYLRKLKRVVNSAGWRTKLRLISLYPLRKGKLCLYA